MTVIWNFIQDEILGMQWLSRLIKWLLNFCGLDTGSKIGGSILFFIYDTIKIMVLLGVLILIISYIQSYFPPERTKKILGRFHGIGANIIAALLGTVTPFCSCSSIPLFIGFTSAGLPLGVTFSFLISSPMVDLGSLVLLMSIFGWKVAVIYVVLGLVIAVAGGTMIEKLHLENQVQEFIRNASHIDIPQEELHFKERIKYALEQVLETAKKVFPYVLVGVGIGALIHNWIPQDFIIKILGEGNPFGVIIATVAGVPMYADIFGTIPIAEALLAKGADLGVVLSFMMTMLTGSSAAIMPVLSNENAAADIVWESSDSGVAVVDGDGNVSAVSAGTATITATLQNTKEKASCVVTVKRNPDDLLTLKGNSELSIDETTKTLRLIKTSKNTVDLIKNSFENGDILFKDIDNTTLLSSDLVGTGTVLYIMDGDTVKDSITAVVYGDVSGDGKINLKDASLISKFFVDDFSDPTDFQIYAMDVNGDGYANNKDIALILQFLVGKTTI